MAELVGKVDSAKRIENKTDIIKKKVVLITNLIKRQEKVLFASISEEQRHQ